MSADWAIVPAPVSAEAAEGTWFPLGGSTRILTAPGSAEAAAVGERLAGLLRRAIGYPLPVEAGPPADADSIVLELTGDDRLGDEGYELEVTGQAATLRASRPAGLHMGA